MTFKVVFHFNRIVAKRSVFLFFVNTQAELINVLYGTFGYGTVKVENGLNESSLVSSRWNALMVA